MIRIASSLAASITEQAMAVASVLKERPALDLSQASVLRRHPPNEVVARQNEPHASMSSMAAYWL
jgi:hypothetical protein